MPAELLPECCDAKVLKKVGLTFCLALCVAVFFHCFCAENRPAEDSQSVEKQAKQAYHYKFWMRVCKDGYVYLLDERLDTALPLLDEKNRSIQCAK